MSLYIYFRIFTLQPLYFRFVMANVAATIVQMKKTVPRLHPHPRAISLMVRHVNMCHDGHD